MEKGDEDRQTQHLKGLTVENGKLKTQLEDAIEQLEELQALAWQHEMDSPPSFSLFRAYELQQNLVCTILEITEGKTLTNERIHHNVVYG